MKGLKLKKSLHDLRMQEVNDEEYDIDRDVFETVMNKFSSKQTKSYDFLLKSGEKFQDSVYKLCKKMILKEEFPKTFRKTILHIAMEAKRITG